MNLHRLWAVSRKETIQLRRDPRSLALAFLLPLLLILLFGYAISLDVRNIRLAVLDESQSAESRALVDAFARSGYFEITTQLDRYVDADAVLGQGRARIVLVIPPTFSSDLAATGPAVVQLLLDGSDANSATIAQNYADAIVTRYGSSVTARSARVLPVDARIRVW